MDMAVVELSRLQFALTAHVPLPVRAADARPVVHAGHHGEHLCHDRAADLADHHPVLGKIFGINFVLGVATGLTMEFEFGTNWSYYSHYVGDIFGAPLAIEGLMAFFLEATFVGLMFFGWDRLPSRAHLFVTFMVALGSNLSALWILIANGWMQNPVGAAFNPDTMRMEVTDFSAVLFNPVAQAKFVHTVSAGYVWRRSSCWASRRSCCCSGKWHARRQALDDRWRPPSAWPRPCRSSCWATRAATR